MRVRRKAVVHFARYLMLTLQYWLVNILASLPALIRKPVCTEL